MEENSKTKTVGTQTENHKRKISRAKSTSPRSKLDQYENGHDPFSERAGSSLDFELTQSDDITSSKKTTIHRSPVKTKSKKSKLPAFKNYEDYLRKTFNKNFCIPESDLRRLADRKTRSAPTTPFKSSPKSVDFLNSLSQTPKKSPSKGSSTEPKKKEVIVIKYKTIDTPLPSSFSQQLEIPQRTQNDEPSFSARRPANCSEEQNTNPAGNSLKVNLLQGSPTLEIQPQKGEEQPPITEAPKRELLVEILASKAPQALSLQLTVDAQAKQVEITEHSVPPNIVNISILPVIAEESIPLPAGFFPSELSHTKEDALNNEQPSLIPTTDSVPPQAHPILSVEIPPPSLSEEERIQQIRDSISKKLSLSESSKKSPTPSPTMEAVKERLVKKTKSMFDIPGNHPPSVQPALETASEPLSKGLIQVSEGAMEKIRTRLDRRGSLSDLPSHKPVVVPDSPTEEPTSPATPMDREDSLRIQLVKKLSISNTEIPGVPSPLSISILKSKSLMTVCDTLETTESAPGSPQSRPSFMDPMEELKMKLKSMPLKVESPPERTRASSVNTSLMSKSPRTVPLVVPIVDNLPPSPKQDSSAPSTPSVLPGMLPPPPPPPLPLEAPRSPSSFPLPQKVQPRPSPLPIGSLQDELKLKLKDVQHRPNMDEEINKKRENFTPRGTTPLALAELKQKLTQRNQTH